MRSSYEYWGPDISVPMGSAPPVFSLPFTLEAEVEIPEGGADGVIVAAGSQFGGWSFYLDDGVPVAYTALSPLPGGHSRVAAPEPLPPGTHTLRFGFDITGRGGELPLAIAAKEVARGAVAQRARIMAGLGETFDTGRDTRVPVSGDYQDEGVFTGEINRVQVRIALPGAGAAAGSRGH